MCQFQIEIQKILELGVDPSRIIYANTNKQLSFIKYAADKGVSMMTFDCEDELIKIKKVYPDAKYIMFCCFKTIANFKYQPIGILVTKNNKVNRIITTSFPINSYSESN